MRIAARNAEVRLPSTGSNEFPTPIQTYDFDIASGSFYLGGLRFEAEGRDSSQTFLSQCDWLQVDTNAKFLPERPIDLKEEEVRYDLVYLQGWEQCVTVVEDSELRAGLRQKTTRKQPQTQSWQ